MQKIAGLCSPSFWGHKQIRPFVTMPLTDAFCLVRDRHQAEFVEAFCFVGVPDGI